MARVDKKLWILSPGFMGTCGDLFPLLPETSVDLCKFGDEKLSPFLDRVTEQDLLFGANNIIGLNPNDPTHFKSWDSPKQDYFESAISFIRSQKGSLRIGLGYSMGARILLQMMAKENELFDALILLSPHPGLSSQAERVMRWYNDQSWARALLEWPWEEFIKCWNAQPVFGPSVLEASSPKASPTWEERQRWARVLLYFSLAHQPDLRPCLQSAKLPILWLVGASDKKFVDLAQSLVIPNGEIGVIPDAYHRLFKDQPILVKTKIGEFLKNRLNISY